MRKDIAKVIVERPRYGGGGKFQLRQDRRKGKDPLQWEDLPKQESLKAVNIRGYNGKYLNDYLAPIRGFLEKNVGRPWDKVNSEIRKHLKPRSTMHRHVLDHIYRGFVELKPMFRDDGSILDEGGRPLRSGDLYVDQHGLLKKYKEKKRKKKKSNPDIRRLNDFEEYQKLDGVWYYVRFVHGSRQDPELFDVILNRRVMFLPFSLRDKHGPPLHAGLPIYGPDRIRVAVEKRQLSKKEIRNLDLNKS